MASGDSVGRWRRLAEQAGRRHGIPAGVLLSLIRVESGGVEGRRSGAGAQGLTQFVPGTARQYGVDVRPGHARSQIEGAARYLHDLGFSKNPSRALASYNAGAGNWRAGVGYARSVLSGAGSLRSAGGGSSSGGGGATVALPDAGGGSQGADLSPGADVSGAVAALLSGSRSSAPSVSGPAAPAYSARAALPQGYVAPSSGGPAVAQGPDIGALLDAVRTQGGDSGGSGASDAGGGRIQAPGATSAGGPTHGMPTGVAGKVIGTPYTGTHTLGDWQSDNAVDIAVPKGTPMVALQDGVIVKVRRHPQDGGRFAGDQITVRGANGNEYFYAHGVADVKPGQRIRKGQQLGVTGSANGVEHLHFGQRRGDPRMHARRR